MNAIDTVAVSMLDAALAYAAGGVPVFPCQEANKRPYTSNGFKEATCDPEQIRRWWSKWPNAMIGMPTGDASGLWVLDIDDADAFESGCWIDLPQTRRVDTGKGYHLYFINVEGVRNKQRGAKGDWPIPEMLGAEVRGEGGYVILPPSRHPSGRLYRLADNREPAAAPAELLALVSQAKPKPKPKPPAPPSLGAAPVAATTEGHRYALAALNSECDAIRSAPRGAQEGTLNAAALKVGHYVGGGVLAFDAARNRLLSAALSMPSYDALNPWTAEGLSAKIDRALRDGMTQPKGVPERMSFTGRPKSESGITAPQQPDVPPHDPDTGEIFEQPGGVGLNHFRAYMPTHSYIFAPTGELWPSSSVNSRLRPVPLVNRAGEAVTDKGGKPVLQKANAWLDEHRAVEQMTWAPGLPQVIEDRLVSDGGWRSEPGFNVFNLYRPPLPIEGDAARAQPWLEHLRKVYPDDAGHLIRWFAHRVQRPEEKINHAIVLGGPQGIGKDTILEGVKAAIGPWNFSEVSPQHMLGRFNGFVKSVILRVSEARDLGEVDRFAFYDHMKIYTAAPPDVLRVDEKHLREYAVFNVCGVIITTNHKTNGIYLPTDDRRHYVAWSPIGREAFADEYWSSLYRWYHEAGGIGHVAAYLRDLDLSDFNAKAPPPKTPAFWDIVSANLTPEDAELADALDQLGRPDATTIARIANATKDQDFRLFLIDRRNSRKIPHRLEQCGYVAVRNSAATDGLFKVGGKRCAIYARHDLSPRDQQAAANRLIGR